MRSRLLTVLFLAVLFLPVPTLCAQTPTLAPADAIHHAGQQATVCGPIAATRRAATIPGLPTFVDLGQTLPNPAFTVILWDSDRSKVGDFPASGSVCVTGTITQYKGVPQMVIEDAKSWSLPPGNQSTRNQPATRANPPARNPPVPDQPLHSTANDQPPTPANQPTRDQPLRSTPSVPSAPVASASATHPPAATPPAAPVGPSPIPTPPATAPHTASSPIPSSPISSSYRIGADDSLQITVWKEPNLSGTFLVRPDGMISLVLAGEVRAAGLTPPALAADLTQRFQKYLQDPLVSVIVVAPNSQKIYLLGEVQHVGPVAMATAMSPLQAIAAAGGLTPYAKPKKIYILRGPQGSQRKIPFNYKNAVNAKPGSSVHLLAGDTIVVP